MKTMTILINETNIHSFSESVKRLSNGVNITKSELIHDDEHYRLTIAYTYDFELVYLGMFYQSELSK